MTLLAGDVIESARDRHMAFVRELAPQGMCLRILTQYHRELLGKIARIDEDVLRVDTVTAMPLAVFANGIALPANRTVVAVSAVPTNPNARPFDVTLVPVALRNDRSTPGAAAWQAGDVLYLRGDATNWQNVASIAIATVPVPAPVLTSATALAVPDTAERAMVENVARALALRGPAKEGLPPIDTSAFIATAADAETAFLNEVRNRLTGRAYHTRDLMHNFDGC
jgi:hypothetical protein